MRALAVTLASLLGSIGPVRAEGERLVLMAEDASEPFSRPDGTGYANDLVRAAFAAAGVEVTLDVVPYARCKDAAIRGLTPACFSMSWSPALEPAIKLSDKPLFSVEAVLFQNVAHPLALDPDGHAPAGSHIGIVNGYEYPPELERLASRGAVLELSVDETALLRKLAKNRLDAAVVMTSSLEPRMRRAIDAGVADQVAVVLRVGTIESFIGFSTRNTQGDWARNRFNAGFAAIRQNGTADDIRRRWASTP